MTEHPYLMIRHRPFNARLPGVFKSKSDVQDAFASLLLGEIQPGNGDFTYRGQPMTLCDPIDTALLPPRPAIQGVELELLDYTALGSVTYEAGFEPVSKALFDDVKSREAVWKKDSIGAGRYAQNNAEAIWARMGSLQLDKLNDMIDEVPEYGREDFSKLRPLYPELSMLSDGALYSLYDSYQDWRFIDGWASNREDGFLFYLLGEVADRDLGGDEKREVGQWMAYALLHGDSLDDAISFGLAAHLYDNAI